MRRRTFAFRPRNHSVQDYFYIKTLVLIIFFVIFAGRNNLTDLNTTSDENKI